MWQIVRITWDPPERRGSVHQHWHEEIVATTLTVSEARDTTARLNTPGNGHCWEIRWALAPPAPKGAPTP